jgi:hypothetical protein
VKLFGIEIWNESKDSVVSFGRQMGVTFPLLMQGAKTTQAYGAQKNYIYLIDKDGIVRAISTFPSATVSYSQIDSVVKVIAAAIPPLLGTAVVPWKTMPSATVSKTMSSGVFGPAKAYDIRGRSIGSGNCRARQLVFLRSTGLRLPAEKIMLIFGR